MGLQQFEQRLERLVEGAFAKAFRGELQPVELGKRLTREMDLRRAVAARGLIAPNSFEVVLSTEDYERFGGFVYVLAKELVQAAREHAREEHYNFLGPIEVVIGCSEEPDRSTFAIHGAMAEGAVAAAGYLVLGDGSRLAVGEDALSIGRLPDCDVTLADANVSRRHAQLRRSGDDVYLIDLGSTNGTLVNGLPVRQHRLSDGDLITLGQTTLRYEVG